MEEQNGIALLAIAGSLILIIVVVLFVVFVITQKRKQHSLKSIIEILKASHSQEYEELKKELEAVKKFRKDSTEIDRVISDNKEIKKDLAKLKKEVFGKENDT